MSQPEGEKIIEYLLNSDTVNYLGFFSTQIQVSGLKKIVYKGRQESRKQK